MRVVLADLESADGFVNKDRVAGGYGNRLRPFSRTTRIIAYFKRRYHDMPSVQMAYVAAICADAGHEVRWTSGEPVEGDVALVLSSLVDYRHETAWADQMRARGVRVGFVGLAASKLPHLFADHADFVIQGEPEDAVRRLAHGERLEGLCPSPPVMELDSLPFPRWNLDSRRVRWLPTDVWARPARYGFPVLASRSCPEHCTYCSHRILAPHRARSVGNVADEIEHLTTYVRRPYIVFRDPTFTDDRERCLALCDEIERRRLRIHFECETRTDRADVEMLRRLRDVGLRRIAFGVESVSAEVLRKVGRRPTPADHQRALVAECRRLGVISVGMFILGFPTDDWQSISATIEFACDLGPTIGSFKVLTPYPATPLWKQMEPVITETDLERFDGFTITFQHPNLTTEELKFLLGAAYTRFYFRPSYLANLLKIQNRWVRGWVQRLDQKAAAINSRLEAEKMPRSVTC